MQYDGSIIDWNDDKGFGFISSASFKDRVFFHIKSVKRPNRRPSVGDSVVFQTLKDPQGRNNAVVVSLVNSPSHTTDKAKNNSPVKRSAASPHSRKPTTQRRSSALKAKQAKPKRRGSPFGWLLFYVYWIVLAVAAVTGKAPFELLAYLAVVSLVTYFTYALDKRAARADQFRVPEANLHFLSLIGGWSGALVARYRLRHKSAKQPFRSVYWLTVVVSLILTYAALETNLGARLDW
jgi:uncharacterized membrane protein YsdA (DUF1294 family)/cold shock CspA family protein